MNVSGLHSSGPEKETAGKSYRQILRSEIIKLMAFRQTVRRDE